MVFLGVCAFCGDETSNVSRPMAGHMRFRAHRNAQRAHTPRETILLPSSLLESLKVRLLLILAQKEKPHFMYSS
jgi:hypothetical protein